MRKEEKYLLRELNSIAHWQGLRRNSTEFGRSAEVGNKQIAYKLGIHLCTFYRWRVGYIPRSVRPLLLLADVLEVPVEVLFSKQFQDAKTDVNSRVKSVQLEVRQDNWRDRIRLPHNRIAKYRQRILANGRSLTPYQLAHLAGCSKDHLLRIGRRAVNPSLALALRLSVVLKAPVSVLFPRE